MSEEVKAPPILVPVDFSEHSEAALLFAGELAHCMSAPIVVLHVIHDPGDAPGFYAGRQTDDELKDMEDVAAEMMEEFMKRIADNNPDNPVLGKVETMLIVGLPVSRILEAAKKVEARIIVMGSKGRTGLSHVLLGSKAEQVVRMSPIPVTIVKANAEQNGRS